ncbi:hypothetical protein P3F83_18055 [Mycobacteroides immunogenum]|uniref:hypothetical protein n=1 Tax=Mycobacteroides immunogenum TaxID=83262 RepID=UPI0025B7A032|nr:hypothetical protein [Mycobacteroides immunogenum]WJR32415.1 hypothetical protein P3F83_18055 [Mycobacteroides immunogenum]
MTTPATTRQGGGKWYPRYRSTVTSIPSGEAFGTLVIDRGPLTLRPAAISSAEAFGTQLITYPQDVTAGGIASAEVFGTAQVGFRVAVPGIASAESVGAPTVAVGPVTVAPASIGTAEAFGVAAVGQRVAPSSIAPAEAFGNPKVNMALTAAGIASAEAFGTPAVGRGAVGVAPAGIASGEAFGALTVTQTATIYYNTQGVGSENNGTPLTCTINPNTGDDVLVFAMLGASSGATGFYKATYGPSNLPMICAGQELSSGVVIAAYIIRAVPAGSATVNITRGTSPAPWGQAVAVSYSGAAGYDPATAAAGTGTSFSHSVTVPTNSRTVQAITTGDAGATLSNLAGGVSRYLDNAGFCIQSIRDSDASTAFTGTLSTSRAWASIAVPLRTSAATGVRAGYSYGATSVLGATTTTFDIAAAVGDYVYVPVIQDRAGDPSSVTCDGSPMTLIDTAPWSSGSGSAFIKIYRSAAAMSSAGLKTVSVVTSGSGWSRSGGVAVSGVTSPSGTVTKTSGTSSQPTQAVTCSAGQMILQILASSAAPTGTEGGATLVVSSAGQVFWSINIALESTTFKMANTSTNWGALALVLS